MGSFKVKLLGYFLLLSLLPMAAAFWGFASVAGQSETRRVDARVQSGDARQDDPNGREQDDEPRHQKRK